MDTNQYSTFIRKDYEQLLNADDSGVPMIAVRDLGLFPGMVLHFDVGREKSVAALEAAMDTDQMLIIAEQKDPNIEEPSPEEIYTIGCMAKIKQILKTDEQTARVLIEAGERVSIVEYLSESPYFSVAFKTVQNDYTDTKENRALINQLQDAFSKYLRMTRKNAMDFTRAFDPYDDPVRFGDIICANLNLTAGNAVLLLQETHVEKRLMMIYQILIEETEMLQLEFDLSQKVKSEMDRSKKEYFLREQMHAIREELGEGDDDDIIKKYQERIENLKAPQEVVDKAEKELSHLSRTRDGSPESGVIESYLDWILDLPWENQTEDNLDVANARAVLDEDHYGLSKVKERILEYIAVLKLSNSLKAPIICLVGPPGVGKTSIARSIARALNRKYVRMSLGGMRDEAEIRGHRRTYVGAIPGRIIYHLKQAGANNPLILLDEIDKLSSDMRGDPASALLEVLDPEQNSNFTDNYMELPFDLSHVLFLTTANSLSTIPRPLLDRMEVIEINGYVDDEKFEIAKRHLIPKQLKEHCIGSDQLRINKSAVKAIVRHYTRESGVRQLDREIARICRVAAKNIVEKGDDKISVTGKNIETYLGKYRYTYDKVKKTKHIGVVTGLAWTAVGGVTMEIEASVVDGKGGMTITGQLGDVMKESVRAAVSYIRRKSGALKIDPYFYSKKDIHVHAPEGAVPKDGPSAGITIATALISALTEKAVPQNIAMTGEITLRGRVLPIGGLREKLTAAARAGIKKVFIPAENIKDLEDVPDSVLSELKIVPVSEMDDVIKGVFGVIK